MTENWWHRYETEWLPWADPECWWDTLRCRFETDWLSTWWTCRVRPPAEINSNTHTHTRQPEASGELRVTSGVWRVAVLLPGKKKAAAANISTAEETRPSSGGAAAVAARPPPAPPLLLRAWTRWFPDGRRCKRQRRCLARSMPDSVIKHNRPRLINCKMTACFSLSPTSPTELCDCRLLQWDVGYTQITHWVDHAPVLVSCSCWLLRRHRCSRMSRRTSVLSRFSNVI